MKAFPSNIVYNVAALGEKESNEAYKNRRIDIILYVRIDDEPEEPAIEDFSPDDQCYVIDYKLLHLCHLHTFKRGNKEWVVIETNASEILENNVYYYGKTTRKGVFRSKKVKWLQKRTGKLWWAKRRFITTVPKKDFDSYKIFRIKPAPCGSCAENFQAGKPILHEVDCIQMDTFLKENLQVKRILFNWRQVKIRAPKEYVHPEADYFVNCSMQNKLTWTTKRAGRREKYYYSKLPITFHHIENITRIMKCCDSNIIDCNNKPVLQLFPLDAINKHYSFNMELGSRCMYAGSIQYATIGVSKQFSFSRFNLQAGYQTNHSYYSYLSYQFHFLSFAFQNINPFATWQTPKPAFSLRRYGRLYVGSSLHSVYSHTEPYKLQQNFHVGLAAVNTQYGALVQRVFVQYGINLNYFRSNTPSIFPMLQLGFNVNLIDLNRLLK
ncbi:hypothetical protein GC194_04485 [bacterium]|nr:hypothetical protein [bacterium]